MAVLLSGGGRTLDNLLQWQARGELPIEIPCVAANRSGARGLSIAQEWGIPARSFRLSDHGDRATRDAALWSWIRSYRIELVILAGYLALLDLEPGEGIPVLNIHPSLLPRHGGQGYYGRRVHEAVLSAGDSVSGCTVHLVDEVFDRGRILGQKEVPVLADDDVDRLAHRVFEAERQLYPEVLRAVAAGEIDLWPQGGGNRTPERR